MTRKGWILFIAMSVIWGIPYLFIKIALLELTPVVVVFARVGIAALVLIPIAIYQGVLRPLRKRWLMLAGLACVQIVGPFLLISSTLRHRSPACLSQPIPYWSHCSLSASTQVNASLVYV